MAWLKLWGKADAPRKLHGAAGLYAACETLVGHSDAQVQALAIECLCKWQQPALTAHKTQLLALIKEKTFRETLTMFRVDDEAGIVTAEQRPLLLPLLSRLLFAKLAQRSGRGASKNGLASRRATIFAFFGGFESNELSSLVDLLLAPLAAVGACTPPAAAADGDATADAIAGARGVVRVRASQQIGVLRACTSGRSGRPCPRAIRAVNRGLRIATRPRHTRRLRRARRPRPARSSPPPPASPPLTARCSARRRRRCRRVSVSRWLRRARRGCGA